MAAHFYQECLCTVFHSFFHQLYKVCQCLILKNSQILPPLPTSKLQCWYRVTGIICSAFWPPNTVCIVPSKEFNLGLIWPNYILPVLHRLVLMLLSKLWCPGVLHGECAHRSWWLSALLIVSFESVVPADSRFSCSSPWVVLGSWTTLLTVLLTPYLKSCGELWLV